MISHAAAKFERFATELGEPYAFEPSFKLCASGLLDERFLMTYQRRSLGEEPWHLLESFGRDLEMPEAFQAELRSQLSSGGAVDIIHLGVEASPEGDVCKVYLENAAKVREQLAGAPEPGRPLLVHRAYKWRADDNRKRAVARYYCQPGLTWSQIGEGVADCYAHGRGADLEGVRGAALAFVDDLEARASAEDVFFMRVHEENNPRTSFDINVYDLKMTLAAVEGRLRRMAELLRISEHRWREVLGPALQKRLGHLSGGLDRHGKPFFSVYFGVEGR